jgi:hypothetical protein
VLPASNFEVDKQLHGDWLKASAATYEINRRHPYLANADARPMRVDNKTKV